MRTDGRAPDELRKVEIHRNYTDLPPGSVLACTGRTRVLCTATIEDYVPRFLMNSAQGWVTAEYGMLPGSSGERRPRDGRRRSGIDGRSQEIQRLIGRALRSITDRSAFPGRTIWLDCDVLQADGGTRTTAITGAYVALHDACSFLQRTGHLLRWPLRCHLAAVSVGLLGGETLLDLDYQEDSSADVDMNLVMTAEGDYVEIQASAERALLPPAEFERMLQVGRRGIESLIALQKASLGPQRA